MSVDSASWYCTPIKIPRIGLTDTKIGEPQVTDERFKDLNSRKWD